MPTTIAVVTDLIFSTKITGTGKALGQKVLVVRSVEKLREHLAAAHGAGEQVQVIVDLNAGGLDPIAAIQAAKADAAMPRVIAFLSHTQVELAAAARVAGADPVMARSGFVERLPALLSEKIPPATA